MNKPSSNDQSTRFSRHLSLPEIGRDGQEAIRTARVLVVGAGGLGCPVIQYLAAAGIGTLGIADYDVVELSNLQRQVIYGEADIGKSKAELAGAYAGRLHAETEVKVINSRITAENVQQIVHDFDIVVDCTDNFPTRYHLNDACVLEGKSLIYGSLFRFEGQVSVFNVPLKDGNRGPNYRDLFPEPPPAELIPDCAQAGVVGCLPGIIGSVQAMEAIKLITGAGDVLSGRLFIFDSLIMESKTIKIPNQNRRKDITGIHTISASCHTANPENEEPIAQISPLELQSWINENRAFELIDVREKFEREIVQIGGQLVPLNEIEDHVEKLKTEYPIVVYCKSGGRSAMAIRKLKELGFSDLFNLDGGIIRWIQDVQPELPSY